MPAVVTRAVQPPAPVRAAHPGAHPLLRIEVETEDLAHVVGANGVGVDVASIGGLVHQARSAGGSMDARRAVPT
jgi:hypothetical protein